jgi:DNA-directed RNA polymerase subunit L
MEIELISKDKLSIEIQIPKAEETLILPLEHELLADSKTEYAAFTKEHPFLGIPKLRIRVKDGKPQTSLKRVSRVILKDLGDFETKLNKAVVAFRAPKKKKA